MPIFDLVVIGGGITGLGIARLAARNGCSVALLERADLGSATSSASSHMLHGGLRYLEHGQWSLVRESLVERAAVVRMAGPLAAPARFLVPLYRGGRLAPWKLGAGLALYDLLAGRQVFERHASLDRRQAIELEPGLTPDGLLGAGLYSDAVMDDARLAIAVARDAAAHGAAIHPRTEVTAALSTAGRVEVLARDTLSGAERRLQARVVVNATGPWADAVRARLLDGLSGGAPRAASLLRPSRGVHLVYPALTRGRGLLLTARSDGRVFFVVPFAGRSLVGTTEVEVSSPPPPEGLRPSLEEVRYLISEVNRVLPTLAAARPFAVFAGVRPLLASRGALGRASREHRVVEDGALLSVVGGKYTTFRAIARDALRAVLRRLGRRESPRDSDAPLPAPQPGDRPPESLAGFAVEHEFALALEDVMRRRTRLWLADDRGLAAAPVVAEAMARKLGWSEVRVRDEIEHYRESVNGERALLARAAEGA